jgi:hypothetical protein
MSVQENIAVPADRRSELKSRVDIFEGRSQSLKPGLYLILIDRGARKNRDIRRGHLAKSIAGTGLEPVTSGL